MCMYVHTFFSFFLWFAHWNLALHSYISLPSTIGGQETSPTPQKCTSLSISYATSLFFAMDPLLPLFSVYLPPPHRLLLCSSLSLPLLTPPPKTRLEFSSLLALLFFFSFVFSTFFALFFPSLYL